MQKSISILTLNVALFLVIGIIYQNATVAVVGLLANAVIGTQFLTGKKAA